VQQPVAPLNEVQVVEQVVPPPPDKPKKEAKAKTVVEQPVQPLNEVQLVQQPVEPPPHPHLTSAVREWQSYGCTLAEIQSFAPWAFIQPDPEPERPQIGMALPEDRLRAYNPISAPASRERPRRRLPAQRRLDNLMRLAEFALLD
jgi:hypothetical protein